MCGRSHKEDMWIRSSNMDISILTLACLIESRNFNGLWYYLLLLFNFLPFFFSFSLVQYSTQFKTACKARQHQGYFLGIYFTSFIYLFILAVLGLHCFAPAFFSCCKRATLLCGMQSSLSGCFSCGAQALGVWASVVLAHGLGSCGLWAPELSLSSCGPWA